MFGMASGWLRDSFGMSVGCNGHYIMLLTQKQNVTATKIETVTLSYFEHLYNLPVTPSLLCH